MHGFSLIELRFADRACASLIELRFADRACASLIEPVEIRCAVDM
jgi:hypothetical protein